MTGSLKYKPWTLYFISQLKFPEEETFSAPGLLNVVIKITGARNYKPSNLYFISQLKFPEEEVF